MSSRTFNEIVAVGSPDTPTLAGRVIGRTRTAWEALLDAFAAHGAYVELTRRGIEPSEAAQIILISHFSQRG